ncbi:hypothetical protein ANCCAN_15192 [Ancylostoma caninum]|uniref:Uncharacterized protein n=1 Tax=Ancylostoma caninum TaxID=29170 RepID=A0A368G3E4_ANCCA|nr:hypothetical protein ANCCAN_15192 [Ancylostoma caninum]
MAHTQNPYYSRSNEGRNSSSFSWPQLQLRFLLFLYFSFFTTSTVFPQLMSYSPFSNTRLWRESTAFMSPLSGG